MAIAAIVIFQSDIRRALAHFGQAPLFRYFNRQEAADETIDEIVVAATIGNSLEAAIAAHLLRRVNFRGTFDRVADAALLAAFAAVGSVISATIGVSALWATGVADLQPTRLWMAWWVSDVLGKLRVATRAEAVARARDAGLGSP